jgi:hypothetical protein
MQEIKEGKFEKEINAKKTDVDPEKRKSLDAYFATIATKQEAVKKEEAAEKAAEEEKKAASAVVAPAAKK